MKVILITLCIVYVVVGAEDAPEVRVKNGLLMGANMETKLGRKFMGFTGIPYAKPPVGPLRFQPPMPMDDWDGIKNATEDHEMCIQLNTLVRFDMIQGVEDCLFLNVYTPKIDKAAPLPVMLYIHGGAYYTGSGNKINFGPDTLLNKDVVLVTINYRLGSLGFLTTGDEVVPGNNGMKDQNLALVWTKENIENFGGDPNSVTIFGESAGACSTHLHMFSPLSKGLFHGAISQSGSALGRWSIHSLQRGVKLSKKLAKNLKCPSDCSGEMIKCLRDVDAKDIIQQTKEFSEWDVEPIDVFVPVVEPKHAGAFISDFPENIIKQGLGSDVPWISGVTTEEGALRSSGILSSPQLLKEFNEKFPEAGHLALAMEQSNNTKIVSKKLLEHYFGNHDIDASNGKSLTDLYTDAYFSTNIEKAVSLHKTYNKQPVYHYLFGFRGSMSYSAVFGGGDTDYGVCHGDELLYMFPIYELLFPDKRPTEIDLKMGELLTTMWTNFAKNKNPTPDWSPAKWTPVESGDNEYLHIKQDQSSEMDKSMFKERIEFWKTLEPLLEVELQPIDELVSKC